MDPTSLQLADKVKRLEEKLNEAVSALQTIKEKQEEKE